MAEGLLHAQACRHAVIMMLSSSDLLQDANRCKALGIRRYLLKPVAKTELLAEILALRETGRKPQRGACSPAVEPGRPLSILVVEDNPVNRKLAVTFLERLRHHVTAANDGREAVRLFEDNQFDLVLMDLNMPEMDGLEAARQMRRMEKSASRVRTPIFALTASATPEDDLLCTQSGMDGCLHKPVRLDDLQQLVRAVSEGAVSVQEPVGRPASVTPDSQ